MNSFYDIPRNAPIPSAVENATAAPTVPEVSMIFNNQTTSTTQSKPVTRVCESYESWKLQNKLKGTHIDDKENNMKGSMNLLYPQYHLPPSSDFCKKQVRFESPVLQLNKNTANLQHTSNIDYSHNRPHADSGNNAVDAVAKPKLHTAKMPKPFEQIYMANIPNRHLDLSIIDTNNLRGAIKLHEQKQSEHNNVIEVHERKMGQETTCAGHSCASPILESVFEQNDYYRSNTMNSSNHETFKPHTANPVPSTYKEFRANQHFPASDSKMLSYKKPYFKRSKTNTDNKNNDSIDTSERSHMLLNVNDDVIQEPRQLVTHMNSAPSYSKVQNANCASIRTQNFVDTESYRCRKDSVAQTDKSEMTSLSKQKNSSELDNQPTVTDLLKIIHQQNEQLLILQKQVAKLIENQNMPMQIEGPPQMKPIEPTPTYPTTTTNIFGKEIINSTGHEIIKPHDMKKGPLSKFAIDVMTSFEVSIRPQQNFNQRNKYHKEFLNHEPKIQEITSDSETAKNSSEDLNSLGPKDVQSESENFQKNDESLVLSGSLPIREDCVSPENSIHIDMQDYSSDSDTDDSCTSSNVGWTIYNNVMDQVNNILQKAQGSNGNNAAVGGESKTTMKKVKEATMKHLKSIGVHLPPATDSDDSVRSSDANSCTPTEISFAVKQLLMKYLPDDQLAKITYTHQNRTAGNNNNLIKRRPEFSIATLQYMEKYNLLASGNCRKDNPAVAREPTNAHFPKNVQQSGQPPKILDITALKQQPKLL